MAGLKKVDEMDNNNNNKKKKKKTKGKTSESSSTRKKSHSKSKEPCHKLSSEALKESGFVTPKKRKEYNQTTPPTTESTFIICRSS